MPKTAITAVRSFADFAGIPLDQASSRPAIASQVDGLLRRIRKPGLGEWLDHAARTQGCSHPVRLSGTKTTMDSNGVILEHFDSSELPDGVVYKSCGNRRQSACPSCSHTYKYDTYQLIKAGMAGGKGVPESVASHPAIFLTLTAPSFGPVHTRIQHKRNGPVSACRPHFRTRPVCQHGRPLYCATKHAEDDPRRGKPLCADCYDHNGHVIWNHFVPDLWARTTITWSRALTKIAKAHGTHVRIRYAKVGEFQHRGLIHIHALLRLDGYNPDDPAELLPPPKCVTVDTFRRVVKEATAGKALQTPPHPDNPDGWTIQWGNQVDVRVIRTGLPDEQITEGHVAGYLAKYVTKDTEATGFAAGKLSNEAALGYANPKGNHTARLLHAAFSLGTQPDPEAEKPGPYDRLSRRAKTFGWPGHVGSKSRYYSTTLTKLRAARRINAVKAVNPTAVEPNQLADEHEDAATVVLASWTYEGTGWLTTADAALAMASAAAARERKPAGLTPTN